ncbi:MAG TPA: hypothetical protein VJ650_09555 [Gemmatimonadaceae bacterium]|nr:hypothetical protein [Gemmatimonadaceae bacterium]
MNAIVSRRLVLCLTTCSALAALRVVNAQLPGIPVIQNAFANPGLTIAVNYGQADESKAYAGALAWSPASARFQLTGGFGAFKPDDGDRAWGWGARAAVPITQTMMAGKLGIGAFAGVGGASQDGGSLLHVPAGVSISWRTRLGERRGISIYAAPFYSWTRVRFDDESQNKGLIRASFGVDVAVVPALGVTVGYELGQKADAGEPGATGGAFGVGVSYALRRGQ